MIVTRIFQRIAQAVFAVVVLTTAVRAQQMVQVPVELAAYPDLIVHNAKIVTMDDTSVTGPPGTIVQAMAIRGDVIQFMGSNAQVLRYAGPQTRKMDLKDRTVVAGLIDTHTHIHDGFIGDWARQNPEEVTRFRKSFSVTGTSFAVVLVGRWPES